jgi:hypothetical protein
MKKQHYGHKRHPEGVSSWRSPLFSMSGAGRQSLFGKAVVGRWLTYPADLILFIEMFVAGSRYISYYLSIKTLDKYHQLVYIHISQNRFQRRILWLRFRQKQKM